MTAFRLAVRTLAKSPGFTTVAVLTLGLGIGATTAIFSVAYGVLRRPLPYRDPGSLVLVDGTSRFAGEQRPQTFSALDIPDWQRARTLGSGHTRPPRCGSERGKPHVRPSRGA